MAGNEQTSSTDKPCSNRRPCMQEHTDSTNWMWCACVCLCMLYLCLFVCVFKRTQNWEGRDCREEVSLGREDLI